MATSCKDNFSPPPPSFDVEEENREGYFSTGFSSYTGVDIFFFFFSEDSGKIIFLDVYRIFSLP